MTNNVGHGIAQRCIISWDVIRSANIAVPKRGQGRSPHSAGVVWETLKRQSSFYLVFVVGEIINHTHGVDV